MKCTKCGNEVQASDTTCLECGAAISESVPKKPLVYREDTQDRYVWFIQKKLVYIIGAAIAAAIAMSFVGTIIASIFSRVDVTQYLEITTDGYNGFGYLNYDLQEEDLLRDLYDLEDGSGFYDLPSEKREQAEKVIDALNKSITADAALMNLSNGDTRTFTFNNLKDIEKATGVKFRDKDQITYKVENLLEATAISFENLFEVDFAGYDGLGCVAMVVNTSGSFPFDLYCSGDQVYIDYEYELEFVTSDNEGALSNGDVFSIGIRNSSETNAYLISQYGIGLVEDDQVEYTVDGLMESQTIDVFSMLEYGIYGLDGDARSRVYWNEIEKTVGNIRIVADEPDYPGFSIYSKADVPSRALSFESVGNAADEQHRIGYFYIEADKEYDIGSGDEIVFRIVDSNGESVDVNAFASSGIVFGVTEQKLTVDATMLERYITSSEQVNAQNVKALATSLEADVTTYLKDHWSRIIHGSSNFICYDQVIKAGPTATDAYFACTDAYSNTYKLWIMYTGTASDSETTEAVPYYILAEINKPTITAGDENKINLLDSVSFSYYESMEEQAAQSWFARYSDVMTVITLK